MNKYDLRSIRAAYARGENITQKLRREKTNTLEGIEVAYDLQAGTYVQGVFEDIAGFQERTSEIGSILNNHLSALDSILDCGTGELTTLSGISHRLPFDIKLFAFDLSLSRIRVGQRFAARAMRGDLVNKIRVFVAAIDRIPFADNSIDVVMTVHALEPNFGREQHLLKELFRVSRRKVILFEPSWEHNTNEGRNRMERLGYVRDLPRHIQELDGRLIDLIPLHINSNSLNPTYAYVIEIPDVKSPRAMESDKFICPITDEYLDDYESYLWSESAGYAYPKIDGVPVLRDKSAILMCHK